jgi:hypothetical protein
VKETQPAIALAEVQNAPWCYGSVDAMAAVLKNQAQSRTGRENCYDLLGIAGGETVIPCCCQQRIGDRDVIGDEEGTLVLDPCSFWTCDFAQLDPFV